jgi:hypothetical protein
MKVQFQESDESSAKVTDPVFELVDSGFSLLEQFLAAILVNVPLCLNPPGGLLGSVPSLLVLSHFVGYWDKGIKPLGKS